MALAKADINLNFETCKFVQIYAEKLKPPRISDIDKLNHMSLKPNCF